MTGRTLQLVPLFVADYRHLPRDCPASASCGPELLSQLSAAGAARHRVAIDAEAFIDGEHRLIIIMDAPDGEAVQHFLAFLPQGDDLHIMAASTAEEAVERGGCAPGRQTAQRQGVE